MRHVYRVRSLVASSALAGVVLFSSPSAAQEVEETLPSIRTAVSAPIVQRPSLAAIPPCDPCDPRNTVERPRPLLPLYASLGVLQALDVHSTSRGLAGGGREANPVMEPIVGNRAAFVAVKAATTAGVVWASERLWRKQNRKAAIVLTTLTNIGLAAVVAHNYRAAR
jgi:hypothetical protein